jgi:hypothetical protein
MMRDSRRTRVQCFFAVSDDRGFMFCRYMYPYFFSEPDCSGGLRDSRTDCLLLIDAFGSTRRCGQHGYLAATSTLPGGGLFEYIRIRFDFYSPMLDSTRFAFDSDSREWTRESWTRAQH